MKKQEEHHIAILKEVFFKLIFSYYKNENFAKKLWKEIVENYTSKNRFYHNLDHLFQMYGLFEKHESKIIDKNTVLLSIFYHDFYYFPKKNDNEFQSAEKLKQSFENSSFPKSLIEKSCNYIIATKNHNPSTNNSDKDLLFFLDFDMSILGSPPENYKKYLQKIRQEYSQYSDLEFQKGRVVFVKNTLSNLPIFKTPEIRNDFEKQAIANLKNELILSNLLIL